MKLLKILILFLSFFILYSSNTFANINLIVSPIKYEIRTGTGSVVTKIATLYNKSDQIHTIYTWKSDFQSDNTSWNPDFVRRSELVFQDQQLSNWIEINTDSFEIQPWEKKEIEFTITVPDNATPWGHYWAVFFKNNNSESSAWAKVNINVDYWVLLLLTVEWEIVTDWDFEDTIITNPWEWSWWWWWGSTIKKDDCPIIDLTSSNYDWKCIDNFIDELFNKDEKIKETVSELDEEDIADINIDDFNINFDTLFVNDWNVHLKPTWTITLVDEDWNEIKWIWKEVIKNDNWAIIWEKIVDYLPINDNEWNVLPNTKRNFESEWRWFPYEAYDETWKKIIKYWTPEEYYTKVNIEERRFLLPWERVNEKLNYEKICANIDLEYTDENWEVVEFSSAKEFYVQYKEKYIWYNPYVFIFGWLIFFLWFFFWFILFKRKRRKCIECNEVIKKKMKICPYCWTRQKDWKVVTKNKKTNKKVNKKANKKKS